MSNNRKRRKQLSELTIKDNFMFAAVMLDPANCKPLLEMILGIDIGKVEVSHEKSIVYNPEQILPQPDGYGAFGNRNRV